MALKDMLNLMDITKLRDVFSDEDAEIRPYFKVIYVVNGHIVMNVSEFKGVNCWMTEQLISVYVCIFSSIANKETYKRNTNLKIRRHLCRYGNISKDTHLVSL